MHFTVEALLAATGGTLFAGRTDESFDGAIQDSRAVVGGELFIPLKDERDGHDFIAAAMEQGAAGYLTEGPLPTREGFAVGVADTQTALVALGRAARARIGGVIGITGSAGKTTTKDMLGRILAAVGPAGVPEGSYNNEIGMPLTLVNAPDGAEWAIVEIGARHVGDVTWGASVVEPTIGIVTNIGVAHIGIFGSRDAIAQAKGELVEALPLTGTAVLNADDPRVADMANRTQAKIVTFGLFAHADVRAVGLEIDSDLTARFELQTGAGSATVRLPAAAEHIVSCALAAAAAAQAAGVGIDTIAAELAAAPRSAHRMELHRARGGWLVVDDAYNANPASMHAAIDAALRLVPAGGRAFALLGTMAELGDHAPQAHQAVGAHAGETGLDVVAVGEFAEMLGSEIADDPVTGARLLRERAGGFHAGDVILVKASRAAQLEQAVPLLLEDRG